MSKLFSFAVIVLAFLFALMLPASTAEASSSKWKCRIQGPIQVDDQMSIILHFVHFDGQPNVRCVQEDGTYWSDRLNLAIRRLDVGLSPAGIYVPSDADRSCDIGTEEFELGGLEELNTLFERSGPDFVSRTGTHLQLSVVKGSCEPTAEEFLSQVLKTQGTAILIEPIPATNQN